LTTNFGLCQNTGNYFLTDKNKLPGNKSQSGLSPAICISAKNQNLIFKAAKNSLPGAGWYELPSGSGSVKAI